MKVKILKTLAVLILASCGGGGGGGGGGGNGQSAETGVRVLHGAVDYAPIQIFSSLKGVENVTSAAFAENTIYGELPEGEQNLTISMKNDTSITVDVKALTVENRKRYSLLLFGNQFQLGLATAILSDDPGEIPEGRAAVRVVHALVGASRLNTGFSDGQKADDINFGSSSSYIYLPAGTSSVNIRRASDASRVASITNEFLSGKAYTILMTGELEFFTVARVIEDL